MKEWSGSIAILGAGNIGISIAEGILTSGITSERIIITRKGGNFTEDERLKFVCLSDNKEAVKKARVIILAVQPKQMDDLLSDINRLLTSTNVLISVASGVSIARIEESMGDIPIVRAMPNTAIRVRESMTCLAFNTKGREYTDEVNKIFSSVGHTLVIPEGKFAEATVLCGSGTALALKFLRVFMQACIQHGFNEHDALTIASQVLKGGAMVIEEGGNHPEVEIDKVTTPGGCTIVCLTEMDHAGFSSAVLKSIEVGVEKARKLYA